MLATVRMHPLLVTHSRDQEKAAARYDEFKLLHTLLFPLKTYPPSRFKRMEVHDIVAESSRYSLMAQVDENQFRLKNAFPQFYELEMESSLARARRLGTVFLGPNRPKPDFLELILNEKSGYPELGPNSAQLFSTRQGPSLTVEGSTQSLL